MGEAKKRRKGTRPPSTDRKVAEAPHLSSGYPALSLRHLQDGYGVDELSPSQCSSLLSKWAKRSRHTWVELVQHDKHGLGSELMPKSQIKKQAPEQLTRDKYMIVRHEGNLPIVGFRAGDIFYALWIEARFGDIYNP